MKNKIISAVLTLAMILSFINISVGAESNNGRGIDLCIGLGCLDIADYKPDQVVTRGQFASILANMLRLNVDRGNQIWNESVYGDKNDSQTADLSESMSMFDDVDGSTSCYEAITAICGLGYMHGIGERRFAPEYDISILEVVKVLCDMAGYARLCEMNGGYPSGYEKTAQSIGMMTGVSKNYRDCASEKDVLTIISNTLDLDMVEVKTFNPDNIKYEKSEKTFMQEVLNTYLVKAVLTDNGITALSSGSTIGEDELRVGDVVATLPENLSEYRKLIGRQVEMYYIYEDGEYTVRYVRVSNSDSTETFSVHDLESVGKDRIAFRQGAKTVTRNIKPTSNLIYNGQFKSLYNNDVFNFETGDITLCSSENDDVFDTIIINDYKTVYAANVNTKDMIVYNGCKSSKSDVNIIDISEDKYPDSISVTDGIGKKYAPEEIPQGSVLSILESTGRIEIIITEKKVTDFVVKSIENETVNDFQRKIISDGSAEYSVLSSYLNSDNTDELRAGEKYTLYLNENDEVAYAQKSDGSDEMRSGILVKVYYNDSKLSSERGLIIFTEDGERKVMDINEKIKVNGVSRKYKDVQSELSNELGNPVLYATDKSGAISAVTTACAYGDPDAETRGWCRISPEGDTYRFGTNGKDFDRFFYYVSGKTKVFQTPTEYSFEAYEDETKFQLSKGGFSDNAQLMVEGFAKSPDSAEADIIVWRKFKDDSAVKEGTVVTTNAFLIEKIVTGKTADDDDALILTGYLMNMNNSNAEYKELVVDSEAIMITGGDVGAEVDKSAAQETVGPRTPEELGRGDVIRYDTNSKGYVNYIRIAYDMSTGKAFFAGRGTEFAEGSSYAGYAVSTFGDSVKLSASVPPENIDYTDSSQIRNVIKSFRVVNAPVLTVEKVGGKITVSKATVKDVLSYKDSNSIYDKIAVFTYYSSSVYGMVIYK